LLFFFLLALQTFPRVMGVLSRKPLGTRLGASLAAGAVLLTAAVVGGYKWSQQGWFKVAGDWPKPWYGYDAGGFFGLLALVFLSPIAFTLFFTVSQYALRRAGNATKLSTYLLTAGAIAALLGGMMAYGWYYADFILSCGAGVFCIHFKDDMVPPDPVGLPLAGEAWWGTLGAKIFFVALIFELALVAGVIAHLRFRRHLHAIAVEDELAAADVPLLNSPSSLIDAQQYGGGASKLPKGSKASKVAIADAYHQLGGGRFASDGTDASDSLALSARAAGGASNTAIGAGANTPVAAAGPWLQWGVYFLCLLPLGLLFFFTTYYPNNWENYAPSRIAAAANEAMTTDPELCGDWPLHSCPELADATFRTTNIKLSDYWNIKLYPSNVIFYTFLALVPLAALLVRSVPRLNEAMSRKVRVRRCSLRDAFTFNWGTSSVTMQPMRLAFFTLKEIAMILSTLTLAVLFFYYWFHDHNFGNKYPKVESSQAEYWCRSMGQVATVFFALLLFPAARNSPVLSLLGVSWEAAIQYHRWLGTGFLLFAVVHMIAAWCWYGNHGGFPADVFALPQTHAHSTDNFTVPLMQWVMWVTIPLIGVFSLREQIRRKSFELFLYAHHITYCLLIPSVLWHAQASWEYMFPGLIIWIVDRAIRAFRSAKALKLMAMPVPANATPLTATAMAARPARETEAGTRVPVVVTGAVASDYGAAGGMVEIRVSGDAFNFQPGQYAFVNVAEVSLFEWHPFTISAPVHPSAPHEITFHIKAMGAKTWTDALYRYIEERQIKAALLSPLPLTLSVDGPYGTPIDFKAYANIILVAGGIGVTPCKSIFESLYHSYTGDRTAAGSSDDGAALGYGKHASASSAALARRVHLLFVARDTALFDIMGGALTALPQGPFSAQLYHDVPAGSAPQSSAATARAQGASINASTTAVAATTFADAAAARVQSQFNHLLVHGRPNFGEILPAIARRTDTLVDPAYASDPALNTGYGSGYVDSVHAARNKTLVFVCGPPGITAACEALAHEQGWDFHTETFAL
jgi:predicted ferric reductase